MQVTLTQADLHTVLSALRNAADIYQKCADECSTTPRIAAQFILQKADANLLMEKMEKLT